MSVIEPAPALGAAWACSSLVWGRRAGRGDAHDQVSPVQGRLVQRVNLLDDEELALLTSPGRFLEPASGDELERFAGRLHAALQELSADLLEAMRWETAFVRADCEEMVQGALDFARGFRRAQGCLAPPIPSPLAYRDGAQERRIGLRRCPWGTVAVILPQNAFLVLGVTCLLNALEAGNRVILRAPLQSARSAALLALVLERAQPPGDSVSVVLAPAREFAAALYRSPAPCLVHYLGSSRHAPRILAESFEQGKAALIDAEGNGWVWVGEDMPPEQAADLLTAGALRYNGQTCTSVNGAIIHPAIYPALRDRLRERWDGLTTGDPLAGDVRVGPLLDAAQAQWCERQIRESGGRVLCGGRREENLLAPTLVERPAPESALVAEGLFGSALWIAPGDQDAFAARWPRNRYPLCAGVLSPAADSSWWLARLPNLARLTVNGDPSVEHIFEPWGGYPGSGANPVTAWREKYQRVVQVDEPLDSAVAS